MRKIVVFSGAGLSADSGIPTFRDADGLWQGHRIEDVAAPVGWKNNPSLVLDFYAQRFMRMQECQPNAAHTAIAQLANLFDVDSRSNSGLPLYLTLDKKVLKAY